MASTSNLSTDITALIQEYYERKALAEREYDNGLLRYAQKGIIPKASSKVIHFHRWDKFALADDVTEAADPASGIAANASEIKAALVEFASYIDIPNFGDAVRLESLLKKSYEAFREQAARTAHYRLVTALNAGDSSGSNSFTKAKQMYANGRADFASLQASDQLKCKDIQRAVAYLEQQGAPKINGGYVLCLDPWGKADLMMNDADFRDLIKYNNLNIIQRNKLPMWAGAAVDNIDEPFRETFGGTEETYAAAGQVVTSYVFGRDSFGVAQLGGKEGVRPRFKVQDTTKTGAVTSIGYRIPFKGVVLNENWVVQLKHVASDASVSSHS